MKEIKLTRGMVALVDDEDYERVNQFKWQASKSGNNFYAERTVWISREICIKELLHRIIMNAKSTDPRIDHRDGDGLNNQKYNLRFCTQSENCMNMKNQIGRLWKGVSFSKTLKHRNYRSRIRINGKIIHLGYFVNGEDAAKAYDNAAIKYFGEFARPNFPICE